MAHHFLRVFFFVVLFWGSAFAPLQAAPAFWKVSRGAAVSEGAVYLFGSFHLLKANDNWLTPDVADRFAASDRLVLETSAEEMDPKVMEGLIRRHALYPPGMRLSDRLPNDLWLRLDQVMNGLGSRARNLEQFRPWYAALVASVQFAQSLGFSPEEGVDRFFMKHAQQQGKPVEGLENSEEQLSFFFNQSEKVQLEFLEDTLRQVEETPAILDDMTNAWRKGDLVQMEELVISAMKEVPEVYDALLVERNRQWLSKIVSYTQRKGDTFIVVGAAHLVGEDSLILMLQQAGLIVQRLN